MLALLFLVPLVLPVCDVYEKIEFAGDSSKLIHRKYIKDWGMMIILGKGLCHQKIPVVCYLDLSIRL